MPRTLTPLRYPGGKTRFYSYVKEILKCNNLLGHTYIEPFAGGAGLAIKLLLNNDVEYIVINDFDISIYSFWKAILDKTDEFCDMIFSKDVTPEEWYRQRNIYMQQDHNDILSLGFATFFLNRTNMSGVIKGGMIGGKNQGGIDKLDARYNKNDLVKKIQNIAARKEQICLLNLNAQEFLQSKYFKKYIDAFINFDPPYVKKGAQLYKNSFKERDHRELSKHISECGGKWIVTYDICPLVSELYSDYRYSYLDVNYSIQKNTKAKEYIFFSNNLIIPDEIHVKIKQKESANSIINMII